MAYSTTAENLPYFDTSWAVLSTIGLCYVLVGIIVASIRGKVSALLLVPIIVSAGCAIANGVHYYEAFVDCPPINQAVAMVFAYLAWMVSATPIVRVISMVLVPVAVSVSASISALGGYIHSTNLRSRWPL